MNETEASKIIEEVSKEKHKFQQFLEIVKNFFLLEPEFATYYSPVHSIKTRIKDPNNLKDKIRRKDSLDNPITIENVFKRITDIAGVRILHLYQKQFSIIHKSLMNQIESKEWHLFETPKAYTWDPEAKRFFEEHGLSVEVKNSFYTSVHYVVKPRHDSFVTCEIQVRTLFEEIWGEIDHTINYPKATDVLACREQILVLAKMVGAGSRLVDSIFRVYEETKGTKIIQNQKQN